MLVRFLFYTHNKCIIAKPTDGFRDTANVIRDLPICSLIKAGRSPGQLVMGGDLFPKGRVVRLRIVDIDGF